MSCTSKRLDVAVFPVLDAVLFPGVSLPIQVFEERYWQMVQDSQARGWPLAISLVTPLGGDEFTLNPICGAGRVQIFKDFSDGSSDILVHGNQRVRLKSFVQQEPYFVMEAELVEPSVSINSKGMISFSEFTDLVKKWVFLNPIISDRLLSVFEGFKSFGELTDFFVFHFLKKVQDKQLYLDCLDSIERAEMLACFLEKDLARLKRKAVRSKQGLLMN